MPNPGSNPIFSAMLSLWTLMIFPLWPFFYSCILCLFLQHFYGLFYHLIFRDISLKSQESFVLFSVIFHLIFSGFYLFLTFFLSYLLSYPIYIRLFVHLFIRLLFVYLFVISLSCLFELFSCPYLFIHFVFFVLVKLC